MGNSTLQLGGGDTRRITEVIIQPGHTFVVGDAIRVDETIPGAYVKAQANTAENAEAVGIIETVAGDSFTIVVQGRIFTVGFNWSQPSPEPLFAAGQVWFLSATIPGELTTTPPTAAGSVIKAMFVVSDENNDEAFVTGYIGVQIGGESLVDLNDIQPVGTILAWAADAGATVPNGWAVCNGQALSRSIAQGGTTDAFKDLFDLLFGLVPSLPYGDGTGGINGGANKFNVPDLRGRTGIGLDGVTAGVLTGPRNDAGEFGGSEDHMLLLSEAPSHKHQHDYMVNNTPNIGTGTHNALTNTPSPPAGGNPTATQGVGSNEGGDMPHPNMQPFLVINYIIRVTAQSSAALLDHDLPQHSDVDPVTVGAPNDCDVIKFNAGTGLWEAAQVSTGVGPPATSVFSFRNQLINGQFDVWQRGLSFAFGGTYFDNSLFFTPGFGDYTADRWVMGGEPDGGATVASVTRVTSSPLGDTFDGFTHIPKYYADIENRVAGGGGSESAVFGQRIEGVQTFAGETVTVSFWINGNTTAGTLGVNFAQNFGTGGGESANVEAVGQEFTVDSSGNWQHITLTFAIPSIAGKSLGPSGTDKLTFLLYLGIGATVNAAAGMPNPLNYTGTISLSNVQVELGATATAFEIRELETEVALCQRYFSKAHDIDTAPRNMTVVNGVSDVSQNNTPGIYETHSDINSGGNTATMNFPVRMRAAPSLLVVQVSPSNGPTATQTLTANFVGEGSVSWRSQNTLVAFLWTADSEL